MSARRRIAVHWHAADRGRDRSRYMVSFYEPLWRALGLEVVHRFGPDAAVTADLALLHVDLSVVPPEYLALARAYPRLLNGAVADIRKSAVSRLLVGPSDPVAGPVIVKTDLNSGGAPERQRGVGARRWRWPWSRRPDAYRVFGSLAQVPRRLRRDPGRVVERFVPEREGALYAVRVWHFLGDRGSCRRLLGPDPILRAGSQARAQDVEVPEDLRAARAALGFDYGKFDFVVHGGAAFLLDANKTPGAPPGLPLTPERRARWEARAAGILAFFG